MADQKQLTTEKKQPTAENTPAAADKKQTAANEKQPAAERKPAAQGKRPAPAGKRQAAAGKRPAAAKRKAASEETLRNEARRKTSAARRKARQQEVRRQLLALGGGGGVLVLILLLVILFSKKPAASGTKANDNALAQTTVTTESAEAAPTNAPETGEAQTVAPVVIEGTSTQGEGAGHTEGSQPEGTAQVGVTDSTQTAADGSAQAGTANTQTTAGESVEANSAETAEPANAEEAASSRPADLPDIDVTSWKYILANQDHPIGDYTPEIVEVENDQYVDYRIYDAITEFISDCRDAGNSVYLSSAYRSYETQDYLFQRKVEQYGSEEEAARIVLPPGTSEHQTGLSADITEEYYEVKTHELEDTAMYQWMAAHCQDYGFIVRYPEGKEDITNIIYEPWHFRYVGVEAATYIMEHGITLEEFLAYYE